jgi:hypothetical protein
MQPRAATRSHAARGRRTAGAAVAGRWSALRPHLAAALVPWLVARVIVGIAIGLGHVVIIRLGPRFPLPDYGIRSRLLAWDASFYRDLAHYGYGHLPTSALRFFPLYPATIRGVAAVVGSYDLSALLVANAFAFALGAQIHHLCVRETSDERLAMRATWFMALAPSAFVLVMGYSEALALSLTVAAMVALRSQRWWWVAAAGVLAGLTRPVGLALVVPVLIEAARGLRGSSVGDRIGRMAAVAGPVVGTGIFLLYAGARFGDPLLPFRVQNAKDLRGGFADPIVVVAHAGIRLLHGDLGVSLHYLTVAVVVILAVACCFTWPASYSAFAVTTVVLALSANNLGSLERYGLDAFPLILTLASLSARPRVTGAVLGLSAALFTSLAFLAFVASYVP